METNEHVPILKSIELLPIEAQLTRIVENALELSSDIEIYGIAFIDEKGYRVDPLTVKIKGGR